MTFLLQTQKLIMSNAYNLTKFIRGHDSKTPSFSQKNNNSPHTVLQEFCIQSHDL